VVPWLENHHWLLEMAFVWTQINWTRATYSAWTVESI